MISVLINAYACSPGMGSEPGMAWNWCVHLAEHCDLHIITEGEFRDKIEAVLPTLPQGKNMHFYYNPVSDRIRKMCWNQGDWRFYKYYKEWQYKTYGIAQKIVSEHKIDIVHQLNMIGFREPGYLWKMCGERSLPFVWGPVDAKEKFPTAYLKGASIKSHLFIRLKNILTKLQLKHSGRIRKAVRNAATVISASSESQKSFKKYFQVYSPLLNETGCQIHMMSRQKAIRKNTFDLLWVGKIDFRKQLSLAIGTLARLNNPSVRLHIVGGGDPEKYKASVRSCNLDNQCIWHGVLSHDKVQELMQKSDLLFFTSVAEGTPHVVLEAIGNNLPVLCFDTCGQGDSVDEKVGIKIELSTPEQSIVDFSDKIGYLVAHREVLHQMAENCTKRQQELSWKKKAEQMVAIYNKTLNKKSL